MSTYDFKLEVGDKNGGTVYLPDAVDGKLPVVIFCHGWGGSRAMGKSTEAVCAALLKSRAAMVTFDFFGCGTSEGPYSQMSYGRWASNLRDVVEWVSRQEWVDSRRIGCFGISSGTTPALRLAQISKELAFVISVATCLGLFIGMPTGPGQVLVENWDKLVSGGTAEVFVVPFGLDFFKDFLGHAPVYGLKDVSCPVYFLQGAKDNPWRRSDAWIGHQVMLKHGLPVKHVEIEGGGHSLDEVPERCAMEVIQWLTEIGILRNR